MTALLSLEGVRLEVRLGAGEQERARPQPVELDVEIHFDGPPEACRTDRIEDTICYARLVEAARELVAAHEFRSIERLGAALHERLRQELSGGARLWIEVTKLAPPIEELRGGAHFVLGDECGDRTRVRARKRTRHGRVRR